MQGGERREERGLLQEGDAAATTHVTAVNWCSGRAGWFVQCSCGYTYGYFVNPANARASATIHRMAAAL